MLEVKLIGGLGNQMFQYAYAKVLELNGYDVVLDISSYATYILHGGYQLDKYNISLNVIDKKENKTMQKIRNKFGVKSSNILEEASLRYDSGYLSPKEGMQIHGYFQSEKYFLKIRKILLQDFFIRSSLSIYTVKIECEIKQSKKSCSLHIRRGDYINNKETATVHGSCSLSYYYRAMKEIEKEDGEVNYFIFSDDIAWVAKYLKVTNAIYIESQEEKIPHEDIYLMSLCTHNIIANSSFSWWGAWLNNNSNKMVIAPKKWFLDKRLLEQSGDIVCKSWIRI